MAIYKPSELASFLSELGIHPKKGLSQNFLIDGNIIRKIVGAANVQPGDWVVEIGPGPGALTEELLKAGASVIAIEKDRTLAEALKRLQTEDQRLEVFCQDVQEFPIEEVLKGKSQVKLIANLPYHLTTPIITRFIPLIEHFSDLVVMVQDEVAKRLTSPPGNKVYGSITVFINYFTNPTYAFKVGRNCFYPPPNVDSAILHLKLKTPPKVSDEKAFFEMTRGAFEQRRKMLRASLKELYPPEKVMAALEKMGLAPTVRPEELSLNEFITLFELLNE